jgi:hypothetical protein
MITHVALILKDPQKLQAATSAFNIYFNASNAKRKVSKTEVISFKESSHDEWQRR